MATSCGEVIATTVVAVEFSTWVCACSGVVDATVACWGKEVVGMAKSGDISVARATGEALATESEGFKRENVNTNFNRTSKHKQVKLTSS